ncbi:hypothetical protein E2562_014649 [Oryza meyeriana var. granulata]|uniref:Uncharacterized protein n=1 Tax=Oryza meyeriana var. granulata TaxID=110450 RepID=A0A6G1D3Q3_9ORYZ|nr:hypothetical protein E2562_014649 [Oryza meyeriana var. granulata]
MPALAVLAKVALEKVPLLAQWGKVARGGASIGSLGEAGCIEGDPSIGSLGEGCLRGEVPLQAQELLLVAWQHEAKEVAKAASLKGPCREKVLVKASERLLFLM